MKILLFVMFVVFGIKGMFTNPEEIKAMFQYSMLFGAALIFCIAFVGGLIKAGKG